MRSSIKATCTQFARLVLPIAALTLSASCSLLVDDALNDAPPPPLYGYPVACVDYCPASGSYATRAYPGGPCECPMFGGTGGASAGFGGMGAITCGPTMVLPGGVGPCLCGNGAQGTQTCDWTGSFTFCNCPMLVVPDNDAGTDADAGSAFR